MGLYKKICDNFLNFSTETVSTVTEVESSVNENENTIGLLGKAEEFLESERKLYEQIMGLNQEETVEEELPTNQVPFKIDEPFIFFRNFASEVGLQKILVLLPHENIYKTIFSYGVETASRNETVSTFDFWDGTLEGNEWLSYSGEDLCPFYQLLSEDDAQLLKHIHIKRFEITEDVSAIILILEDTPNSYMDLETIEMVLPNLKEYLVTLADLTEQNILFQENEDLDTIKDKVYSEIMKFNTGFLHTISLKSIFRDLQDSVSFDDFYHIFSVVYHFITSEKNDCDIWYVTEELEIRNVIFAQTQLNLTDYTDKLNKLIKECFSIENPVLEISYEGNSLEEDEIYRFLFSES